MNKNLMIWSPCILLISIWTMYDLIKGHLEGLIVFYGILLLLLIVGLWIDFIYKSDWW